MLEFIIHFAFWYGLFLLMNKYMTIKLEHKVEKQNELIRKINEQTHIVKSEHHGDVEYWFDSHDDTFLAQGKTMLELVEHCRSRFPDHSFFIVKNEYIVCKVSGPDWTPMDVNIPLPKV